MRLCASGVLIRAGPVDSEFVGEIAKLRRAGSLRYDWHAPDRGVLCASAMRGAPGCNTTNAPRPFSVPGYARKAPRMWIQINLFWSVL